MSGPGLADLIADAIEALELDDVTLVGNDTGGGLSPDPRHPAPASGSGASCSPPATPSRTSRPASSAIVLAPARVPGVDPAGLRPAAPAVAAAPAHRLRLAHPGADRARRGGQLRAAHAERPGRPPRPAPPAQRAHPRYTLDAAARLTAFDRPALIAWSAEDRFFPPAHGERLARILPDARLESIEGARTFSAEDRPERLAELIAAFVRRRTQGVGCVFGPSFLNP